jgi:hypothetical protein
MKHTIRGLAMALVALCLFGCGSSFSQGSGSSSNGNGTPTSPPGTPPGTPGTTTPGGAAGQVTLTLSKQQYASDEPLLVTIHNGLSSSIWIQGQPSSCTSLTVEIMTGGTWQAIGHCAPVRKPQPVAVAAGASTTGRIDYAQGMDTGAGWPAGTYRVILQYTLSAAASISAGVSAQSATFTIS